MANDKLQTLKVVTRDPEKYLLVNLEDGTFFQGLCGEEPVDDDVIRRRSTLMWKPGNIELLLRALNILFDTALDMVKFRSEKVE